MARFRIEPRPRFRFSQGQGRTIATVQRLADQASSKSECETCWGAELKYGSLR